MTDDIMTRDEYRCVACGLEIGPNDAQIRNAFGRYHRSCHRQRKTSMVQMVARLEEYGVSVTADFTRYERELPYEP